MKHLSFSKYNNYKKIIKKMSNKNKKAKTMKGKKSQKNSRVRVPVVQLTERGRRIRKYESIVSAAATTGVNSGSISKVVRGICQTAGGYRWANA